MKVPLRWSRTSTSHPRPTGENSSVPDRRTALLLEHEMFRGVDASEMEEIAGKLPMVSSRRGTVIYAPGETGEALFILKKGLIRAYRLTADGHKIVLATYPPGTAFGEMSLIGQSMTGSFAEAVEDSMICIMSRVDVEAIMVEHPVFAVRMVQLLSQRLRDAEDRIEQLAFASAPARVARLLLELASDGVVDGFSHQDLSDMIGANRETVSRVLVKLKAAGIVAIDGRRCIRILDPAALKTRVEDL